MKRGKKTGLVETPMPPRRSETTTKRQAALNEACTLCAILSATNFEAHDNHFDGIADAIKRINGILLRI